MNYKKVFNLISYLRFPFFLWGIYFLIRFFIVLKSGHNGWEQINNFLILTGIGLAFASLKDPARKTNLISKRIWKNQSVGILMIVFISLFICALILLGLSTLFFSNSYRSESVAVGMIVLGIGMIGYLKYAVERINSQK